MIKYMQNGQSAALNLSNEQLQVLVSGKFGDGCLSTPKSCIQKSVYSTNCIHEEYIDFKHSLLGELVSNVHYITASGYAQTPIWTLSTHASTDIDIIKNLSIEASLNLIDELGLALWFYDDGSLHKTKMFYNLNTHKFSEDVQRELFVPFFKQFGITVIPTVERKKDGRRFWYLRISRYGGAFEISEILNKYKVNCYSYKIWSSETIHNWSKLQEQLKCEGKSYISNKQKAILLKQITDLQDIVRTA